MPLYPIPLSFYGDMGCLSMAVLSTLPVEPGGAAVLEPIQSGSAYWPPISIGGNLRGVFTIVVLHGEKPHNLLDV